MSGNIAFGRFDDSFSAASLKAYVAEFISTLVFVFAGVGSAIAYSEPVITINC
jgi:aquaporin TIP